MSMLDISIQSSLNETLFKELEECVQIQQLQCYNPLYTRFFSLDNWKNSQLNSAYTLSSISLGEHPIYEGTLQGKNKKKVDVFFKLSPLLDPLKYLAGEYENYDYTLPTSDGHSLAKLSESNNSSYVDSFFSYLTSRLLHQGFVHGLDFYGSYLGIKENFVYNVEDDLEYLHENSFFHKNRNVLFTCEDMPNLSDSRKYKQPLLMENDIVLDNIVCLEDELPTDTLSSSKDSDSDYEELEVSIQRFPIQLIALEACESTLDELMEDMPAVELQSALMQIIMILLVYEHIFDFTHNDLHTNNVMYISTTKAFLYYQYKDIKYKVPTFGRIYKLIDFGRAIYRVNGQRFVSDSFNVNGDAATQYNMVPFLDESLPIVEPHYSFDLCRLACSMYDLMEDENPLKPLIIEWCKDDEGDSVLYDSAGRERYPNFKLYTMISRTVTKHTPEAQLTRPEFKLYETTKVKDVIHISAFQSYK